LSRFFFMFRSPSPLCICPPSSEKLKAAIGLPPSQEIGYQVHSDAMSRTSSRDNKNKYSI
jgi:hypothetical protein